MTLVRPEIAAAIDTRRAAASALSERAPMIGEASAAMAARFDAGATLHSVGRGVSAIDADHVTVEFVHPVIVGKRALPALSVVPGEEPLITGGDIVLGLRLGADDTVDRVLGDAREAGALTLDLAGLDDPTGRADLEIVLAASDPLVARELQVTAYHVLWELVHEYLDVTGRGDDAGPDGLGELYPFLYARGDSAAEDLAAHVEGSTRSKVAEITELRSHVLDGTADEIVAAAGAVAAAAAAGGRVWTFGNGGSSTDARAVAHLLGTTALDGQPIAARALPADVATVTALANDVSFDVVFARMLRSLARPDDVAVAFSTSGGSANVLQALDAAHQLGMTTVGLAGYDGGDMAGRPSIDHLLVVGSSSVHRIQEAQTTVAHLVIELARAHRPAATTA